MGIGSGLFGRKRPDAIGERDFGERALALVLARPGVVEAVFDDAEFAIAYRTADGHRPTMGLTSVWRRAARQPAPQALHTLEQFVHTMTGVVTAHDARPDWAVIAPRLRPLLRQAGELSIRVEGQRIGDQVLWRPALPMLIEKVVIDAPDSMATVTAHDLAGWGVDAATVFGTAHANMTGLARRLLDALDPAERDLVYLADEDGDLYAGSLPFAPGWLHGAGLRYRTRPLVFVPGNTGVLLGFASSPERVAELVHAAAGLYEEAARPVSPMPYTLDAAGGLVPYAVPPGHPAWAAVRAAESALAAAVYRDQYRSLRADPEDGGTEDFAAELLHVARRDGVESTVATWTDGVPTLLPRAHAVVLADPAAGTTVATGWEALAREIPLDPVPGLYPPRYRVRNHPHPDALRRLAAADPL